MGRATSKGNEAEVKDETTFRYAHAKIRTRVVVICGPTCYYDNAFIPVNIYIIMSGADLYVSGIGKSVTCQINNELFCMLKIRQGTELKMDKSFTRCDTT